MLNAIGDAINDPDGDRFDDTKKEEFLDRAKRQLVVLLCGLGKENLLSPFLVVSPSVAPTGGVVVFPSDFFAFQYNTNNQPIVEVNGKVAIPISNPAIKDFLTNSKSMFYADEDNPAFYLEKGGVVPFPADSSVVYHYVRKPKSFINMDTGKECELPRNLHSIIVQGAIVEAANIDKRSEVEVKAAGQWISEIKALLGGL